jgi:uncharacterized phage protein (TIGR02220 family)
MGGQRSGEVRRNANKSQENHENQNEGSFNGGSTKGEPKPNITSSFSSSSSNKETPTPLEETDLLGEKLKAPPTKLEIAKLAAVGILAHLNAKAGKKFTERKVYIAPIAARILETGGDLDGIQKMIDRQVLLWSGEAKSNDWLNPETLFGPEKFAKYYDQRNEPTRIPGSGPATNQRNVGIVQARTMSTREIQARKAVRAAEEAASNGMATQMAEPRSPSPEDSSHV